MKYVNKNKTILWLKCLRVGVFVAILPSFLFSAQVRAGYVPAPASYNYQEAFPNYKVAVILVTFTDNPTKPKIYGSKNPWTKNFVDGELFSNKNSMASYFTDVSNGEVSVTGDVFDNNGAWYVIDTPTTEADGDCDWTSYFGDAIAAADADIDYTKYNTIMVLSRQKLCGAEGLATHAPVPEAGNKRYGIVDINGNMGSNPHHELAHLMGLAHANSWQCDPPAVINGTNCKNVEYADHYNIMGATGSRSLLLTAQQLENYGWLPPADVITVTQAKDYTIYPYELSGVKPKVLKIPQARDASGEVTSWYYLEYRQSIGFDNVTGYVPTMQQLGVPNGVLVHMGNSTGDRFSSTILDMTPGSLKGGMDIYDPALPLGSSYSDSVAGVSFGVLARNASAMAIRVRFSGQSLCEWKAPTVTKKNVKDTGRPGQELRFDLTVKNNATLCSKQAIELRSIKAPAGWTVTVDKLKNKKTASIVPGQTQKFVVRVVPPKKAKYQKNSVTIETRIVSKPALKQSTILKVAVKK
jgi:hypothetical protein